MNSILYLIFLIPRRINHFQLNDLNYCKKIQKEIRNVYKNQIKSQNLILPVKCGSLTESSLA
jgi:hypothetical protein